MELKRLLPFAAAVIAVACASFLSGRQFPQRVTMTGTLATAVNAQQNSETERKEAPPAPELSRINIANIGAVGFEHAYDLVRTAPPEQWTSWSQQLQAMSTGPARSTAVASFFKLLVQIDPKAAVDLALGLTKRDVRDIATRAISTAAPANSFPEVARLIGALEVGRGNGTDLVIAWSQTDPVAAGRFVQQYPKAVEDYSVAALASNWAALDPAAAKIWLERLDPERVTPSVVVGFVRGWFEADRLAAVNYVVQNQSREDFKAALRDIGYTLFAESPAAASAFVRQLENANALDAVLDEVANSSRGRVDEQKTLESDVIVRWMLTFSEEQWRDHLGTVLSTWNQADPRAVDAWFTQLPLPLRDQVAASFWKGFDSGDPQSAFVAGLSITDRALREKTLREVCAKINTQDQAGSVLEKLQLSQTDRAEVEKALADL